MSSLFRNPLISHRLKIAVAIRPHPCPYVGYSEREGFADEWGDAVKAFNDDHNLDYQVSRHMDETRANAESRIRASGDCITYFREHADRYDPPSCDETGAPADCLSNMKRVIPAMALSLGSMIE
jgi:hypothetical protein